jgi:hypothetical protein
VSLKHLAIKPGELGPLDRAGLLLFASRCVLRVEPWWPVAAVERAGAVIATMVAAAQSGAPVAAAAARTLGRKLSDLGAMAYNALPTGDQPLGRCQNYAMQALVAALDAAAAAERPGIVKAVIDAAKLAASIPAILGHAGRVLETPPPGQDAVDLAATTTWAAMRADIGLIASRTGAITKAPDAVSALRELGGMWAGSAPSWAAPPP